MAGKTIIQKHTGVIKTWRCAGQKVPEVFRTDNRGPEITLAAQCRTALFKTDLLFYSRSCKELLLGLELFCIFCGLMAKARLASIHMTCKGTNNSDCWQIRLFLCSCALIAVAARKQKLFTVSGTLELLQKSCSHLNGKSSYFVHFKVSDRVFVKSALHLRTHMKRFIMMKKCVTSKTSIVPHSSLIVFPLEMSLMRDFVLNGVTLLDLLG